MVTLLLGEDESVTVTLPAAWLPVEVREGTVLNLTATIDQTAMQEGRDTVQSMLDGMQNEP